MKKKLKTMLKPKRFEHSIHVAEEAEKMARRFDADPQKAYIAGLVHDCAKNMPEDEMLKRCTQYGITLSWIEKRNSALIHAPLGAQIAREEFFIEDIDILNAIAYHTVGRAGMSILEKIIYVADMIEPGRSFPGVDRLRKEAQTDLDHTALLCIESAVKCNLERRSLIHPGTIDMWNDLIKNKTQKG